MSIPVSFLFRRPRPRPPTRAELAAPQHLRCLEERVRAETGARIQVLASPCPDRPGRVRVQVEISGDPRGPGETHLRGDRSDAPELLLRLCRRWVAGWPRGRGRL